MRCPELQGKVAIVTGASRGIGKGIAARLGQEGCKVVLAARSENDLKANVEGIKQAGGEATYVTTDVSRKDSVENLFAETVRRYGPPHILINNAGWANPIAHILEMDEQHWDSV